MTIRTLKQLRRAAPKQDRHLPALELPPRSTERRTNYEWAASLDQLVALCGVYAEAVEADTCWTAILVWLEREWDRAVLTNGCDLSFQVATIMRDDDRIRLRLPNRARKPWASLLPRFPAETRAELQIVRAELIADWERAGRPGITAGLIKRQHGYMLQFIEPGRNRR